MIILITGSRAATRKMRDFAERCVRKAKTDGHTVITGDAYGVDEATATECQKLGVPLIVYAKTPNPIHGTKGVAYRWDFNSYTERDRAMVDVADQVVCIWDGKSPGTKLVYEYAEKIGKIVSIHT